jgi:DNA polymerase III alpha subunit
MEAKHDATGEMMAFITVEDLDGMIDCVVFPAVYRRFRRELSESIHLILEGVINRKKTVQTPSCVLNSLGTGAKMNTSFTPTIWIITIHLHRGGAAALSLACHMLNTSLREAPC